MNKSSNIIIRESNSMVERDYEIMSPFIDSLKQNLIDRLRKNFSDIMAEVCADDKGLDLDDVKTFTATMKRLLEYRIPNSELDPGNRHPLRVKDAFDYIQKHPHVLYGNLKEKGDAYQFTVIAEYKWEEEAKIHNIKLTDACITHFLPKNNYTQYYSFDRLSFNRVAARGLYILGCKWKNSFKRSFSLSETEIRLKFGLARYKDIEKGITDDNIEIIGYKDFRFYVRNTLIPSLLEIYEAFVQGNIDFWLEMIPKRALPDGRGAPAITDYEFLVRTDPKKIEDVPQEEIDSINEKLANLETSFTTLFSLSNAKEGAEKVSKGYIRNIKAQALSTVNPKLWLVDRILEDCLDMQGKEVGRAVGKGKSSTDPETMEVLAKKVRSTLRRKYGITSK